MRQSAHYIILLALIPLYIISLSSASQLWKNLPKGEGTSVILPTSVIKVTAVGFDGIVSDFLFLKAITFYGQTFERKERPRVKESEWKWMYDVLNASTDLDPYFFDPYYFANANFTWEAHMVKETNTLLAKGNRSRDWDWMPAFFMGFNEFYFLQNNAKASEYLMEASKRVDSPPMLATLATRLAYKANRAENAIIFVQATLKATKDKATRKELATRLETLKGVLLLERASQAYKEKFSKEPGDVNELLSKGIISNVPVDPYGGEFYIDKDGSVKTTSDMFYVKKQ